MPSHMTQHQVSNVIRSSVKQLPYLIRKELVSSSHELEQCSHYLIDGRGKAVRPTMVLLMSAACNYTTLGRPIIDPSQLKIAMITEMIHTASLVHDDIIDGSDTRRGKPSINKLWGEQMAVRTGNFILTQASRLLASLNNPLVIDLLTNVIEDLVRGEIMQLDTASTVNNGKRSLLDQYLEKTFKKTASLMAYSCQAVAVLSNGSESLMSRMAYNYGRDIGLAFQILDDVLDFRSTHELTGKPVNADLKLGLATAPVILAAEKNPEVYDRIKRRFSESDDIPLTLDAVHTSDALAESCRLAASYSKSGVDHIKILKECPEKQSLVQLAYDIVNRTK